MNHVSQKDLEWRSYTSPKGGFEAARMDYAGAMKDPDSRQPFEMILLRIPAGQRPWPYHSHGAQWEHYFVMEGSGEMRLEDGPVPITKGDAMMCPPGEAHQLINTGEEDLVVQIVADNPPADYCNYPDSGKWACSGKVFRMAETVYYDGEE